MLVLMPKTNCSSLTSSVYLFGWEIFFDTPEHFGEFRRAIKAYPEFENRDWAFEVEDKVVAAAGKTDGAAVGVVGDFDASPELIRRLFGTVKRLMAKAGCVPKKIKKGKSQEGGCLFVEDNGEWIVCPPALIAFHRGGVEAVLSVTAVRWGDSPIPDMSENG